MVEVKPNHKSWLLSSIYAGTNKTKRDILWRNMEILFDNYKVAWLMGGDFNDVTRADKKIGGKAVNQNRARKILTS